MKTLPNFGSLLVRVQSPNLLSSTAPVFNATRHSSEDVRFLTKSETTTLKRGRGGRSSFSGVVATVFGATGLIGKVLCNRLGKVGTQMIIPYRGEHYDVLPLKLAGDLGQVLFTPFHLCDEESIRKAVKYSNVVINLVGRDWNTRHFTFHDVNVEGARRIARISKEMGVEKFIHMSALNSNIEHKGYILPGGSEFLRTKGESEEAVKEYYPDATIFRPSDVWGQQDRFLFYFMRFFRYQTKFMPLPYAGKNIWKQPVCVSDVAQGIVNAVYDHSAVGKIFEAVGPRRYELAELILWFHRVTRRNEEDWGFRIYDMKWDPITILKARLNEYSISNPIIYFTRDKIEREAISDITSDFPNKLPNLEDLGVKLTKMEGRMEWELKPFSAEGSEYIYPGLYESPKPPPYIEG